MDSSSAGEEENHRFPKKEDETGPGVGDDVNDVKIGLVTIWAIGVGSALGGDFFGWQLVLYGGFFSAIVALIFAGLFYWLYAGAITELATRYRTSGGAFDFVRCALGTRSASMMAILGFLKLVLSNSTLALAISSYLEQVGLPKRYESLYNFSVYAIFTTLDCIGIRQSANAQVVATIFCVVILVFWAGSCLTEFTLVDVRSEGFIYNGALGFFQGLPFALQFFDGFEEIPLLMSYASDAQNTIPRAVFFSYISVAVLGVLVLVSGSGISDAAALLDSETPLMDGIDMVYGAGTHISDAIAILVVVGLLVNFFAFVLFSSQQVQAIAEAGQLPEFLAYRHPVSGAPICASIVCSLIGYGITSAFSLVFGPDDSQRIFITASLTPAVLSYYLLLECIVRVRDVEASQAALEDKLSPRDAARLGHDPQDLRFVYGTVGARAAQAMCIVFLGGLMVLVVSSREYFIGIVVVAVMAALMYAFMALYSRSRPAPSSENEVDGGAYDSPSKQKRRESDSSETSRLLEHQHRA